MKKDETFDLIIKGFGVYFLVLAIIAIPSVVNGLIMMGLYLHNIWGIPQDDTVGNLLKTVQTTALAQSAGSIIKFTIYIIASINFLRSGSWVKKLMGKKMSVKPVDRATGKTP